MWKQTTLSSSGTTTVRLTFDKKPVQYVVGIGAYSFKFNQDDGDQHIKEISLTVQATPSGGSDNALDVTVTYTFDDASYNNFDPNSSSVTIAALAWLGTNSDQIVLQNSGDLISQGNPSSPISVPGSEAYKVAVLSGFDLKYGGQDDEHLLDLKTEVYPGSVSAGAIQILGDAYMEDSSKNNTGDASSGAVAWVNGGLIYYSTKAGTLNVDFQSFPQNNKSDLTVTYDTAISDATVFLMGERVSYGSGGDNHVYRIGAGPGTLTISDDKKTVTLTGATATVADAGNHQQDDDQSYDNLLVVATYA
jgi:hypothetical protein